MRMAVPDLISNSYFPAIAALEIGFFKAGGLDAERVELLFPVPKTMEALREGELDFVAGSAHSTLTAFKDWKGARLLVALAQRMYWPLVLRADLEARRGDGPPPALYYTFPALVATEKKIGKEPEAVAGAIRAIIKAQKALREDPERATEIGRKPYPPTEAGLIAELIKRDLPYCDPAIPEKVVARMNRFAQDVGLLTGPVSYEQVVAIRFRHLWSQ